MSTKSLLINFSGYPNEPYSFVPDNGLANLAACLIKANHSTIIWDYSKVDIINNLFPYQYNKLYQDALIKITSNLKSGDNLSGKDLYEFHKLEDEIDAFQHEKMNEIAIELSSYIGKNSIDFVGMKLWTGLGFYGAMIIAKQIKKDHPNIPIFGGGPHVDWFKEMIYKVTDVFDALVYGDGEEVIVKLAEHVQGKTKLKDIPNLIYRENGSILTNPVKWIENPDELPMPVYDEDVYPAMKGDQKVKVFLVDESRGCPNSCSFCIHSRKDKKKWVTRDANKFVDQIEYLSKKYKARAFRFAGTNTPPSFMKSIAQEILKRNLSIIYSSFMHVRGVSKDFFELLKKSGCSALAFGVESGSQRILNECMDKKVSVEQIKSAVILCKQAGIKTVVSLIVPAPMETAVTQEETMQLLLELKPDSTVVFFPTLILGTRWEREYEKYGFTIKNREDVFKIAMTHRVNHLCPPLLWRDLSGYSLDGKTFKELGAETSRFVQKLKNSGLVTQLFDSTLLIADYARIPPGELANQTHSFLSTGDYAAMGKLISSINSCMVN
ncbi:MAG: B12-binding domain-containing radical SAM protein [Elusimicrobia bacterium]|nr:B12-binding domain-containing radical SAM protein [Candidatus Liberimonas magnetica]